MSKTASIQTNALGRQARYARSWGPVTSGPMLKHWDEWGEIVVVRDSPNDGAGFIIRWSDGTLSTELGGRMIEVLGHGSRAGGFVDIDMVKEGVQDCAIRTRHGIVIRVSEWDSEDHTHVEFFNKGEFPRTDEVGSAELYMQLNEGDYFEKNEKKCASDEKS
jgi:hypothetical protein